MDFERANRIMSQLVRLLDRNADHTVDHGTSRGPILIAFDPRPLFQLRQHDNRGRILFPDHTPEIGEGFRKGPLKCGQSMFRVRGPKSRYARKVRT